MYWICLRSLHIFAKYYLRWNVHGRCLMGEAVLTYYSVSLVACHVKFLFTKRALTTRLNHLCLITAKQLAWEMNLQNRNRLWNIRGLIKYEILIIRRFLSLYIITWAACLYNCFLLFVCLPQSGHMNDCLMMGSIISSPFIGDSVGTLTWYPKSSLSFNASSWGCQELKKLPLLSS